MTEEMADVYICLDMLRMMYDIDDEKLQKLVDYKVNRQRDQNSGGIDGTN